MNIKINKFKQLPVKIHSPELSFHHKLQINLPIMNCDLALYFKTEQNEEKWNRCTIQFGNGSLKTKARNE